MHVRVMGLPYTCIECILFMIGGLTLVLLTGLVIGRSRNLGMKEQERFDTFASATTSASPKTTKGPVSILDERCMLNANVSVDTGLGMQRHPTDSHSGTCVVLGIVPGNGVCDSSNTVLFDPNFVSSVNMELVDGSSECVIRLHQGLSDDDARSYGDALSVNNVEKSESYIALKAERVKCSNDKDILSSELLSSKDATNTANKNWKDQITADAASMTQALQTLRVADAAALSAAVSGQSKADLVAQTQAIDDARSDEQTKAAALMQDSQARNAANLRNQQDQSNQAQQAALQAQAQDSNNRAQGQAQVLSQAQTALQQAQAQLQSQAQALAQAQAQLQAQGQALGQTQSQAQTLAQVQSQLQAQGQALAKAQAQALPDNSWAMVDGNLPYHEYQHSRAQDVNDCKQRCQNDNRCTFFSFDTRGNECWLKEGGASGADPYASQGGGFVSFLSLNKYPRS